VNTKIYYVRHGETVFNKEGRFNGQPGAPLNEVGRSQAREAGAKLTDVKFDLIYASPLSRAYETCEIIVGMNRHGGDIIVDDRIIERSFGIWEGVKMDGAGISHWWDEKREPYIENGETIADVFKRVRNFMDELKEKHGKGKTILVVAHQGVVRAVHYYLHEKPADGNLRKDTDMKNGEVRVYDFVSLVK